MTRAHLRWVLASVMSIYVITLAAGVYLRFPLDAEPSGAYTLFKDLIPLIIAIPAAYLAFAFQRRNSYLQALRALWSDMVDAISTALVYTKTAAPGQDQYLDTLRKLSAAIEEVRGVFKNVPVEHAPKGWYPFEPVKQIYQTIYDLGYGEVVTTERREQAHAEIYGMWRENRSRLLAEFDRDKPTYHHAEYARVGPRHGASAPLA
jgi:hypothetical protein